MSRQPHLIRRTWRARQAWATGRKLAGGINPVGFASALAGECEAIDRRVRATIARSTARRGILYPAHHVLLEHLSVGAWCRPGDGGELQVQMALGTLLAIDDLALFATTMASFLIPVRSVMNVAPPGARYRLDPPLRTTGEYRARVDRFFDYHPDVTANGVDPHGITFALPAEGWRVAQAALVAELAIAWVLFHEYSHWALAHPALLAADSYALGLADESDASPRRFAFDRDSGRVSKREERLFGRSLEILADTAAFHLLVNYARERNSPIARFNRIMANEPRRTDPQCLASLDPPQTLRVCLTAAALACVVLDGSNGGRRSAHATHPSPSARFMNLQAQTPVTVPGLLGEVDGYLVVMNDEVEGFSVRQLAEMIALSTIDTQLIAGIAAVARNRSGRPLPLDPRTWHRTAWRADMRRQWRTGEEDPENQTPAGRELDRLPLDDERLNALLRQVQIDTFGSLFDIYMHGLR